MLIVKLTGVSDIMSNKQPKDNIGVGKGRGRPAGSLNKTTMAAKEALTYAFEGLGGAQGLVEWAMRDEKNESAFWTTIYPKLLPLQVDAKVEGNIIVEIMKFGASEN